MIIEKIESEGIYYLDMAGQKVFCSFKKCNDN